MNAFAGLTNEQLAFARHPSEAFIQACPGAGKTRSIVARLSKLAEELPPRKGVAVLSFTNSAVDEFKERCQSRGCESLLRFPSYVGTLDAFVRHFVVLPGGIAESSHSPIIVDSWDALGVEIRLRHNAFRGEGVSLDRFDPVTGAIDPTTVGLIGLQRHVAANRDAYIAVAQARRNALYRKGYISAACARARADAAIRDIGRSAALGRALASRFHEVIIDEGQDCNPLDHSMVVWLRCCGIRVTIVSDIDQSIYEFRAGNPDDLRALRANYAAQNILPITGNFRSAPAICRLAATLRAAGNVDEPLGPYAQHQQEVRVTTYEGGVSDAIGSRFLQYLPTLGLSPKDAIVLAHGRNVAQRAAGDRSSGENAGATNIQEVARAVSEFWSRGATPRSREVALKRLETVLLDAMEVRGDEEHITRALHRLELDPREFRRIALSLIVSLPRTCPDRDADRDHWIECVRNQITALGFAFPEGKTVRTVFRRPPNGNWSALLTAPAALSLKSNTVHDAKGKEYKAVCVVIPPNRAPQNHTQALFTSWEQRVESEAKRVIYVGVTRAELLINLAVPRGFGDTCIQILTAGNVPVVREDIQAPA